MANLRQRVDLMLLAALLLALPLVVPFLQSGLPATGDAEIHLHRLISAAASIDAGYVYPRWAPHLHHGFGYPIHNFYAPGIHIIGALIWLATRVDPVSIIGLLQTGATLLYPLGAYLFARTFSGRWGALLAAAAYTYAPLRFHELWTQTNLSQYVAMALIPFLFYALARANISRKARDAAWVAVIFAAIILIHHPTGFITAPAAGVYALIAGWRSLRRWSILLGGLALGLAIAGIFWLPALAELQYTQISRVQQGSFNIVTNLVPLARLLLPVQPVDQALLNAPRFFAVGTPQLVLVVAGLLLALLKRQSVGTPRLHALFGTVVFAVCVFMMVPASEPVWFALPIANLIVYPWRLLGIAALAVIPGAAVSVELLPMRWRAVVAAFVIGVLFAFALPMRYAPLRFYEPQPRTLAGAILYEQATGNLGLTSANEYLPIWVTDRPLRVNVADYEGLGWQVGIWPDTLPADACVTPAADCARGSACYTIESAHSFRLSFNQMYFPGWSVWLDGSVAVIEPDGPHGLMSVDVPGGTHTVVVRYAGTSIQHAAEMIALVAVIICGLLVVASIGRRAGTADKEAAGQDSNRLRLRHAPLLIVLLVIGFDTFAGGPLGRLFDRASDPARPPAQQLVQASFGDMVALVGYDLDRMEATPGERFRVTLYWRRIGEVDRELRAAVKLTDVNGSSAWASAESINLAGSDVRTWSSEQYGVDTFILWVDESAPPFVGQVRVVVFSGDTELVYVPVNGTGDTDFILSEFRIRGDWMRFDNLMTVNARFGDRITLAGVGLARPDAETVCVRMRWSVTAEAAQDYTVLLHQLDADGALLAAADAPPFSGMYPTSRWQVGQTLDDEHCFALTQGAAQVAVGLYGSVTLERAALAVTGEVVVDNTLRFPITRP